MMGLRIFAISMRSAILSILFILSRTEYSTDVLAAISGHACSALYESQGVEHLRRERPTAGDQLLDERAVAQIEPVVGDNLAQLMPELTPAQRDIGQRR